MIWLNGTKLVNSSLDRGLLYGDGFFTTILVVNGKIANWPGHWQRIDKSVKVLSFPEIDEASILSQLQNVISLNVNDQTFSVAKLLFTRGYGGKGYCPPSDPEINCYIQMLPFPDASSARKILAEKGQQEWSVFFQKLTWSSVFSSIQPSLAGVKHLNRLENVLAQKVLNGSIYTEAVMSDINHHCIGGTQSNLCVIQGHRILTPELSNSGVKGTSLAFLKNQVSGYQFAETVMSRQDLLDADEIFLCNAVRGVMPVTSLEDKKYQTDQSLVLSQIWVNGMYESLI